MLSLSWQCSSTGKNASSTSSRKMKSHRWRITRTPQVGACVRAVQSDVEICDGEERRGRSKEMKGLCFFFLAHFFLFSCSRWSLIHLLLGLQNESKSPLNSTYIPPSPAPHRPRSFPTSRTELSSELQLPDPTLSENDKDHPPPKLDEDRTPPKMRKRWMQ